MAGISEEDGSIHDEYRIDLGSVTLADCECHTSL